MLLSTHAHNVARILCRACVTITCICMCFFFSYIYIHALIPHAVGFSPAHLFLHTSAFSYIFTFTFSLRAFWHVNARKHTRACTSCLLCSHSCTCKLWHSHIHELACPHVSAMLARVCTCAVWSFFILLLCTLFLIKHCAVGLLPAGHFLPPCMLFSIKHCAISPLFAGLPPPHCTLFFVKHCARARYSWSLSETTSAGRLLSPSYVVTIIFFWSVESSAPVAMILFDACAPGGRAKLFAMSTVVMLLVVRPGQFTMLVGWKVSSG